MLKPLTRAAAALALLFAPLAHAQQAPLKDADPALWVVKDRDTTIYLFGTVHVLKPGLGWFDEAVKKAFDRSRQVMLEIVEPDAATMEGLLIKLGMDANGPTISSQLPPDKLAAYRKILAELGAPVESYDHFKPWLPAVAISVGLLPKYGYDPQSGAEKVIAAAAKAAGKPLGGLETAEQQLGYFASLPRDRQLVFLEQTIDQVPDTAATLDQMVASWAKGDVRTLGIAMNKDVAGMPDMARILLTERNARWATWIAKRMRRPGTVFLAVGAGHLAGPNSVQAFLEKHHLHAMRINY